MENFDDLENLWNKQASSRVKTTTSDLIRKAESNMKRVKIGQFLTIGILSTLTSVLIGYFVWAGVHRLNGLSIGLGLMIGVILVRIILEWVSVNKLKRIKPDSSMIEFSDRIARFYVWRRKIHLIFIPTIYITYTAGFTLLLPSFKANLSPGMYLYVLISGFGSLIVLALFIARKVTKEAQILNLLKSI